MTCEELEKLIEQLDWDDFQRIDDGNIHCFSPTTGLIRFCYRVGLHLKRPMEAIMAKGDFIKMRAAPQFGHLYLERLDPENVDSCIYDGYNLRGEIQSKGWYPKYHSRQLAGAGQQAQLNHLQQQVLLQAQQGMSQYQVATPILTTTTITTDNTSGGSNAGWPQGLGNSLGGLFKI